MQNNTDKLENMLGTGGSKSLAMNQISNQNIKISGKNPIGFKNPKSSTTDRIQGFKIGGPIRALGNMDSMIHISGNTFTNTQGPIKKSSTPAFSSSKMPQRPGSSKPIPKGNLLSDAEHEKAKKRPDSSKPK